MRIAATGVVLAAALLSAGCGGSKQSAPRDTAPTTTAATIAPSRSASGPFNTCLDVPTRLAAEIRTGILLDGGKLSHIKAVTSKAFRGMYFVSARVDGGGAVADVATWVTPQLKGSGPVYAVDSTAALISSFGAAIGKSLHLGANAPGAYRSRVCAVGPKAPHGQTAPVSGGNAPTGQ
ncbi:MAG: hypothetical protein ABR569_12445 [Gaiellaceae bacterium]